jgi:uncharacterized protein DUF6895
LGIQTITKSKSKDLISTIQSARLIEKRLLGWVKQHQSEFSLTNASDTEHYLQLLKPLGELVLTCDLLAQGKYLLQDAMDLLEWSWRELKDGQVLHDLLLSRPDLIILTSIYSSFHRNGFRRDQTWSLIEYLAKTSFARAVQFPNWRRLDYEHALEQLRVGKISQRSLSSAWSAQWPEPWLIEHDSAYALTHEIFYITDFGRKPTRLKPKASSFVLLWLPTWIEIFLRQDNWDLVSELLMVGACLPKFNHSNDTFGRMAKVIKKNGYLPGPDTGGQNLKRKGNSRKRSAFLKNYHTTLVGIMAADIFAWQNFKSSSLL